MPPRICPSLRTGWPVQALLRGISPRSEITHKNWTSAMGERLRRTALGQVPPFACSRGTEAATYATLPTPNRCACLGALRKSCLFSCS